MDARRRVQPHNHHAVARLLAGDALHVHVPHRRQESSAALLTRLVVEVDFHHGLATLSYLYIFYIDVLHNAASARIGLDAQHAVKVGRIHHAVVGKHVLAAAANLGADDHAAMTVAHLATTDDDVLRRHGAQTSIVVTPALDGDAIITRAEKAVFYQHAVARLRVAAVTVRAVVHDLQPSERDICGHQRMHHPEG